MGIRDRFFTSAGPIKVRIRGASAGLFSIINFDKETRKIANKAFNKALLVLRKEIRNEAPVRNGNLRRSVKILKNIKRKNDFEGEVGPDGSAVNAAGVSYAPFVIFGTRKSKRNNFLRRGEKNSRPKIRVIIRGMKSDLKSVMRKVKSKG